MCRRCAEVVARVARDGASALRRVGTGGRGDILLCEREHAARHRAARRVSTRRAARATFAGRAHARAPDALPRVGAAARPASRPQAEPACRDGRDRSRRRRTRQLVDLRRAVHRGERGRLGERGRGAQHDARARRSARRARPRCAGVVARRARRFAHGGRS